MKTILALSLFATLLISACGEKEVSFATLEEAKQTARENALWNAQAYRQSNPLYKGWDIVSRGDSTQMSACPQGDGWATLEFISTDKSKQIKIKCSTVSSATGCLEDADFKTKAFAAEDGHCQAVTKVPFPLPKIAK